MPRKVSHPHTVCTPVHPSSTPVSLQYHFAVRGACPSDSSADPSDNLVSGYLDCPHLVEETQTRLKIRGATLLESGPGWSRRHMGVGAELLEVATPPSPPLALAPGVQPTSKVSCCAGGRQLPPRTHTGAGAAREGPALAEGVPDLCPRKVVLDREP